MLVSRESNLVTLINVFETRPEKQQELIIQMTNETQPM